MTDSIEQLVLNSICQIEKYTLFRYSCLIEYAEYVENNFDVYKSLYISQLESMHLNERCIIIDFCMRNYSNSVFKLPSNIKLVMREFKNERIILKNIVCSKPFKRLGYTFSELKIYLLVKQL